MLLAQGSGFLWYIQRQSWLSTFALHNDVIDLNVHAAPILHFPARQICSRASGGQAHKQLDHLLIKSVSKSSWLRGFPSIYCISTLINELFFHLPSPPPIDWALQNLGLIAFSYSETTQNRHSGERVLDLIRGGVHISRALLLLMEAIREDASNHAVQEFCKKKKKWKEKKTPRWSWRARSSREGKDVHGRARLQQLVRVK